MLMYQRLMSSQRHVPYYIFLSEALSSAKRMLRATDFKKKQTILTWWQKYNIIYKIKLHNNSTICVHFLGKIACQSSYLRM